MGKINLGGFGNTTTQVAPMPNVEPEYAAAGRLGGAISAVGYQAGEMRQRAAAAQASNNLLDHQLSIQEHVETIRDGLATGNLDPNEARTKFNDLATTVQPAKIDHLTPEAAAAYSRGAKRVQEEAGFKVDGLIDLAHRQQFKDSFTDGLDKLGKLAGEPGADVNAIITQAKTYAPVGRAAGVPAEDVDRALQNWTDQTWLNDATNKAIQSTDSMKGLKALQHQLSAKDGFYIDKLDVNKRNAVLAQVTNRIDTLQNRLMHEADKREADAQRAMYELDRQTSTGVPAPPEQMANWASRISGTSFAPDFQDALKDNQEIQDVLRLPPDQQLSFVQDKQAKQDQEGATVRDQQNLARTKSAVDKNINTMQQAPLLFNAQRTGQDVTPLDWSALLDPGASGTFAKQLAQRSLTIATMQKQYGPTVQNKPLLPQEAAQVSGELVKATPDQAASIFSSLRKASGDDQTYRAIIAQVAPDSPVKALAGLLASKQRDITLQRNFIASDVLASSPDVARTMLQGDALLNPGKDAKGQDGKPKAGLYLPDPAAFQAAFTDAVGTAFSNHSGALETAYQAAQAYYVGKADQTGRLAKSNLDIDPKILKEAITATIGTVVDYNGKGQVVAPWGMDTAAFQSGVQRAWQSAIKAGQIPKFDESQLHKFGLENDSAGTYKVKIGEKYLTYKGAPVVLNVDPRP